MNTVTVVGAGFSGLTLAYHLRRAGVPVRLIEKQDHVGGLIATHEGEHGIYETAANAVLSDAEVEKLFAELNVPFAERKPARRRRLIFWDKPVRWPLGLWTTARLVAMMGQARLGNEELRPRDFETIYDWARRTVNGEFEERLLSPALQGVFAGDPKRLSAKLALSSLFGTRASPGKLKGSVAPARGMGQLMQALRDRLRALGTEIEFRHELLLDAPVTGPTVLCTSAWAAADITQKAYPELSDQLRHCESLPMVSATLTFNRDERDPEGFGCLFPTARGFTSAGVVFNNDVFAGRSSHRSETWIIGGALNLGAVKKTDDEIRADILKDRARLRGAPGPEPLEVRITRWPRAIPHYTIQWEKILANMTVERPLFLHGNYLGRIGLSKIHQRSVELAAQLKDLYGA